VPERNPDDQVSLARAALAAAKANARARGLRPAGLPRQPATPAATPAPVPAGAPGGEHPSGDGEESDLVPGMSAAGTTTPAPRRRGTRAGLSPGTASARPGFPRQPSRADPQPLAAALESLLDAEGWGLAAATGSVFGRWAQIVGADLAAHTTPESLSDGELTVTADSTAWATQVRLLAAQLVRRLNTELGDGTVRRVRVRGPVTSTRKPGEWRVRGGRGPRDTYG
jgi:predicted nucleic acid-binding Zn ribbon protein